MIRADSVNFTNRSSRSGGVMLGSLLFGIGCGIAGFCPGPALTSILTAACQAAWFVLAMLVGMGLFEVTECRNALANLGSSSTSRSTSNSNSSLESSRDSSQPASQADE